MDTLNNGPIRDTQGKTMNETFVKYALVTVVSSTCAPLAFAQESLSLSQLKENDAQQEQIEEVYIIGSRSIARSAEDSVVPVDVLSADDLEQAAAIGGEVGHLLQALIPSFNMPRQSNSDSGDIVRSAQLRGLNPDQTLVLINGKRRHISSVISTESKLGRGTSSVDFNNIPTSAIKRIEVLRDGASAQYGSDAIAGVINIVLKDNDEGGIVSASFGTHYTDFEPTDESITDGETVTLSFNHGLSVDNGAITVSGEFRDRASTNRAGFDQLPTIGFAEYIVPVPASGTPAAAPNDALAGKKNYLSGDGEASDINLMYNAQYNLSNTVELYSFGSYSKRKAEGSNFFRYPVSENNVTSVYPNGFVPISVANITDFSLAFGVTGKWREWAIDNSLVYGNNLYDKDIKNTINSSLGAASPRSFDLAEYEYAQTVFNSDAKQAYVINSIPINVAIGVEWRNEQYNTTAGDRASYIAGPNVDGSVGAQGSAGLQPSEVVDVSRDAFSVYIDTEIDISDKFLIATAVRFEDYEDFGTTTNAKLATRYEVIPNFSVRGAISSGFRAPSLSQINFSGSSTSFGEGGALVNSLNLPVSDPLAIANGARDLTVEESVNSSIGFVYASSALSITVDFYQIDITDRIALSETITVAGVPNVGAVRFFTNVADTETRGFDIISSYQLDDWQLTAAYNQSETEIVNNPDATIFGVEERNTYETAAPKNKLILSASWSKGIVDAMVRATRYGETERVFGFGPTQTFGNVITLDTDIQVSPTENWTLALGANNLLDEYPDRSSDDIGFFGNLPYDGGVAPGGVNGRFVYLRTSYRY
jgi:iron complex outermembrane recepter protein